MARVETVHEHLSSPTKVSLPRTKWRIFRAPIIAFLGCILLGLQILLFPLRFIPAYESSVTPQREQFQVQEDNLCERPKLYSLANITSSVSPILEEYIQWHRQQRECLSSPTCHPKPKLLIWVCPQNGTELCAGVGDRFRGLEVSLILAMGLRRLFFISWPTGTYPLDVALMPNFIDWRLPHGFRTQTKWPLLRWFSCNSKLYSCSHIGRVPNERLLPPLHKSEPVIDLLSDDIEKRLGGEPVVSITTRMYPEIIHQFIKNPYVNDSLSQLGQIELLSLQRQLLKTLFRPTPNVEYLLQKYKFPPGSGYISIHARTGVDVGESMAGRFEYINQNPALAAERLLICAHLLGEGTTAERIYIASDSQQIKRYFNEEGSRRGMQVKYIPQRALHMAAGEQDMQMVSEEERCDGFLHMFVDMMMIAGSDKILSTGSGFSAAALLLGNSKSLTRVRVQRKPMFECGRRRDLRK